MSTNKHQVLQQDVSNFLAKTVRLAVSGTPNLYAAASRLAARAGVYGDRALIQKLRRPVEALSCSLDESDYRLGFIEICQVPLDELPLSLTYSEALASAEQLMLAVMQLIRKNGVGPSAADLASELNISATQVQQLCESLQNGRMLQAQPLGTIGIMWLPTDNGREWARQLAEE